MCESFHSINLVTSNMLNMKKINEQLEKFNNCLYIQYDYLSDNFEDISYECIPELNLKLRAFGQDDIRNVVSKLECNKGINIILLKSMLVVLANNDDLFHTSEILSHGTTYQDAVENLKSIIANLRQLVDCYATTEFNSTNEIVEIKLENDNLHSLILKIVTNINAKIVLIPTFQGRCVLSAFLLVNLLLKECPDLKTKLTFILPKELIFVGDNIICTESWLTMNRNGLQTDKRFSVNFADKRSCFLILDHSNLFAAMVNYVSQLGGTFSSAHKVPAFCLVQETVYGQFVDYLKAHLSQWRQLDLLDRNRQIAVNFCDKPDDFTALCAAIADSHNVHVLSETMAPCADYRNYYPTLVIDNCQPQQPMFRDPVAAKFCSFLLTFRTCQEAIVLANQICRHRDSLYLWTESISQCFSLKKQLFYDEIFVNIGQNYVTLTAEPCLKFSALGSFFVEKTVTSNDVTLLSANEMAAKILPLKSNSKWRQQSFFHRYSRVVEVMNKMVAAGLLSADGGKFLLEFLNLRVKPFQFSYLIRDSLNKLTESFPIGCVVVDLGECDVSDVVVQALLLVWLYGNDLVVLSANDIDALYRCFVSDGKPATVVFIRGRLSLSVLAQCSFVDSVVCFDDSLAQLGVVGDDFHTRFLYKDLDSLVGNNDGFDDIVSFVRKQKSMYILSGDVGIS